LNKPESISGFFLSKRLKTAVLRLFGACELAR